MFFFVLWGTFQVHVHIIYSKPFITQHQSHLEEITVYFIQRQVISYQDKEEDKNEIMNNIVFVFNSINVK